MTIPREGNLIYDPALVESLRELTTAAWFTLFDGFARLTFAARYVRANNLSASGGAGVAWQRVTLEGRLIFVADARPGNGKRFVVHAGDKLTAFLELESSTPAQSCG